VKFYAINLIFILWRYNMTRTKSSRALLSVVLAVLMAAAFMPSLTYSSFAATAKKATKVTKLNHTGAKVYGKVGSKYTLKYKLSPKKLTSSAQKTVWKSSDSSVVKVIAKAGKHATVKVKGVGTAKITVYTKANKKAKAVWSFKTKKPAEAAAPTIDTSKVQTTYGLATKYNKVASSITKADLLKNVTAKDASGKDVTVSIASIKEVSSTGDYINTYDEIKQVEVKNQAKHFEVTYTATDANGKTATKDVVITVKNLDPEVTATNFSVAIGSKTLAADRAKREEDLINKGITAVNDYESFPADTKAEAKTPAAFEGAVKGNTIKIVKVTDSTGKELVNTNVATKTSVPDLTQIQTNKAGTYNITYKVTDYLGASVEKTVTMTVANNQAPTIATTSAKVYTGRSDSAEKDVLAQLTYNDAEDGQNVKVTEENLKDSSDTPIAQVKFIDVNGNEVKTSDPYFFTKVAKAYVINVRDKDGAFAQTKLIDITVVKGLELTAKDQTVDVNPTATSKINPMSFITATFNGAAYTLNDPSNTINGNTTVYINGNEVKGTNDLIDATKTGTYTVKYVVKATIDNVPFEAQKTITVKVTDKTVDSAKTVTAQIAAAIAPAKTTDGTYDFETAAKENKLDETKLNAAKTAYDALSDAAKKLVPNENLLEQALNAVKAAKDDAYNTSVANGVKDQISTLNTKMTSDGLTVDDKADVEKARANFDALTAAQKTILVTADRNAEETLKTEETAVKNAQTMKDALNLEVKYLDNGNATVSVTGADKLDSSFKLAYTWFYNGAKKSETVNSLHVKLVKTSDSDTKVWPGTYSVIVKSGNSAVHMKADVNSKNTDASKTSK
jgi:hypothetical protein